MYASTGECVMVLLDKSMHARLVAMTRGYIPDFVPNADWLRDLEGIYMACSIEEITTRLDTIIQLLETQDVEDDAVDAEMLEIGAQLLLALA